MRITNRDYRFRDATEYGFAPDERCDWCGGEFKEQPIKNQDRTGFYSVCCSEEHLDLYWDNRFKGVSFRARFQALVQEAGYKKARKALLPERTR